MSKNHLVNKSFKAWLIANKKIVYYSFSGLLGLIAIICNSFSVENGKYVLNYDFNKTLSKLFLGLSDNEFPLQFIFNFITIAIFVFFTFHFIKISFNYFVFPARIKGIIDNISQGKLLFATLIYQKLKIDFYNAETSIIRYREEGFSTKQIDVARISSKVILPQKNLFGFFQNNHVYITTLVEPRKLIEDDEIKALNYHILEAIDYRKQLCTRIFPVKNIEAFINTIKNDSDLVKLFQDYQTRKLRIILITQDAYKALAPKFGVEIEYVDFMLIGEKIICGLKNDEDLKTLTENDEFILYMKDDSSSIENYSKFCSCVVSQGCLFDISKYSCN